MTTQNPRAPASCTRSSSPRRPTPRACSTTWPRRRAARPPRARACRRASLDEYGDALTAAGTEMAERFRRGGRLYTFGNGGSSTDAATLASLFSRPARGRPVAGVVAGRRRGGRHRAGQRRRIRADLQAADHRPLPRPRRRDRVVDVRQLRGPDDGDHRGEATRAADNRIRGPRRWPDGCRRGPRLLFHGALTEHSPHSGKPRDARVPAVVGGPGTHGSSPQWSA